MHFVYHQAVVQKTKYFHHFQGELILLSAKARICEGLDWANILEYCQLVTRKIYNPQKHLQINIGTGWAEYSQATKDFLQKVGISEVKKQTIK